MSPDDEFVTLTKRQMDFLMAKFEVSDPDMAVERFVEYLVLRGEDPMKLLEYLSRMMARENN